MNKIIEMLSGENGISTVRVASMLILLFVMINWTYLTWKTGVKQPLSWEEIGIVLGALGIKVAQRPFEKPLETPTLPPKL